MQIKKLNNNTLNFRIPDGWNIKLKNGQFLRPYNSSYVGNSNLPFEETHWFHPSETTTKIFNEMENLQTVISETGEEFSIGGFVNEEKRKLIEDFIKTIPEVSSYSDSGTNDGMYGSMGEKYSETMERWKYERQFRNAVKETKKRFKNFVKQNNIVFDETIDLPENEKGNLIKSLIKQL